ncbi:threonine synthase [Sphingobacterium sp. lm-10]|uniref:threonine synthase n=1 Tax=Sphingobacterium sp. lm-10 TaxID=2944904 RepID=UPI0020227E54|nr:threonine synthase [Sphingobacterium sp. lm-10]MCL7987989.1 threonine synthase [Sphingobacterium sp. lm-10]
MKFYSTNNKALRTDFKNAVFNSLPADKGLYMPEEIPKLDPLFIKNITHYSLQEIALEIAKIYVGDDIPAAALKNIVEDAINFEAPIRFLDSETGVLELFHGPSFAFKDFGARFMSRIMGYFSREDDQLLDVLVATSGDTGGAVALGFLGVPGTRVTILYPKGKVSKVQEQQLTTNGQNIRAIEVEGTFDDCQALVKQAFNDPEVNKQMRLTSANSINISRLIPQTFYYFWAYAQLRAQGISDVVFTVPSGNYGNIGAGLLAYKMGLPVTNFVAATNANDTVPRFLTSGTYEPKPSVQTLANAMDVGDPSNWVRIQDLFNYDLSALQHLICTYTYDDEATLAGVQEMYDQYGYVACPHTAIAYLASKAYRAAHPGTYASILLSTAHPCKFPDAIPPALFKQVKVPAGADYLARGEKQAVPMQANYDAFKTYLIAHK